MPCDYKNYPWNWKTGIRVDILSRAENRCEHDGCKIPNGDVGYRDKEGKFYSVSEIMDNLENNGTDLFAEGEPLYYAADKKPIKIVLTIAHLDHDTKNNDYSNLKALCQLHHLRHDIGHHKQTRRKNKGLQELF